MVANQARPSSIPKAAFEILARMRRAMHYREIVSALLSERMIRTQSVDPEHSVHSALCKHIRKQGERSWFMHVGPGMFALTRAGVAANGQFDMSWIAAASIVLAKAGKPLHYTVIQQRILDLGLKRPTRESQSLRSFANMLAAAAKYPTRFRLATTIIRTGPGEYCIGPGAGTYGEGVRKRATSRVRMRL